MINAVSSYRRLLASLLAVWMGLIIVSGIVFIHKEVTSKGEIITHIHPYDFRDKAPKHHHKSDAEIHYLDVVFHASFSNSSFFSFETPIFQSYGYFDFIPYYSCYKSSFAQHYLLRGPPSYGLA